METIISNDDRIAIAEVDYIIHHMNERYLEKIPQKVQDYITILKKRNIQIYVNPRVPLEEQGLHEFTLYFLMILNLKYWCDDVRRKEILSMLEDNQKKYDEKIKNIFDNAELLQSSDESSRQVNKPRQIIVTGTPTFSKKDTKSKGNQTIEELAKETNALTKVKKENFWARFMNKIKSILIKK